MLVLDEAGTLAGHTTAPNGVLGCECLERNLIHVSEVAFDTCSHG